MGKRIKQLSACLALGLAVTLMGQACGQMEPTMLDSASNSSRSAPPVNGTQPGNDGSNDDVPDNSEPPITQPPTPPTPTNYGVFSGITALGRVSGEARDPAAPTQAVTVFFFVNGPQGTGMAAGQTVANLPSQSNTGGNTRYSYEIPAQFRNGTQQTIYAYAFVNGTYQQLGGSPITYTAYTPRAAGQTYYNDTVRPLLQTRCGNCHDVSYNSHYVSILKPTRAMGGTALENELINKAAGINHRGGNFCGGGKNAMPCQQIQQWWNLEFN